MQERAAHRAVAGLMNASLIGGLLLLTPAVPGQEQPTSTVQPSNASAPALQYVNGTKVDLTAEPTPYAAVHFVAGLSTTDVQSHMEQTRLHAAEDAGVLHLFVVASDAEQACKGHDGGLVRLVRDHNGEFMSSMRVDTGVHTVVVIGRNGKELDRVQSPHSYSQVSAAVRQATKAPAIGDYNLPKNSSLALEGYDPVAYFTVGKAVKGSENITTVFRGVVYRFSSEDSRGTFAADPERYLPTYGGWCASAMGDKGTKVEIDPKNFKVKEGRLFLFYKSIFADAKSDWNKHEKEWEPSADVNWKKLTGEDALKPVQGH